MKSPSARTSVAASVLLLVASVVATVVILLVNNGADRSHHQQVPSAAAEVDEQGQIITEGTPVIAISYDDKEEVDVADDTSRYDAAASPTTLAPSHTATGRPSPVAISDIRAEVPTSSSPTSSPTERPVSERPTSAPIGESTDPFTITGSLVNLPSTIGLKVAAGLTVRVVAQSDQRVAFTSPAATRSHSGRCRFHVRPDGAATFDAGTGNGDWYYCSNSEVKEFQNSAYNRCNGNMQGGKCRAGVYCLLFDEDGHVKDYQHRLGGDDTCGYNDGVGPDLPSTSTNCQGGVTPFDTYVSCEETGSGYCWQVDPLGLRAPERIEALGMTKPSEEKGGWEAMAVDNYTNPSCPVFFFSEDRVDGKIWRLRPDCGAAGDGDGVARHEGWDMLHKGNIKVDYLEFLGGCDDDRGRQRGKFRWTNNKASAGQSARSCYPYAEGITTTRGRVMFVTKASDLIFTLDQTTSEWQGVHSHANDLLSGEGNFQRWPDQITVDHDDFMFLTTDGSSTPGVYIHNLQTGKYYTLWQSRDIGKGREESVGHAISPNGRFIVGALQKDGRIFLFARENGEPFSGFDFALRRR